MINRKGTIRKEALMKRTAIGFLAVAVAAALVPQALEAGIGIKGGFSLARFAQESNVPPSFDWEDLPFFAGGLSFGSGFGFVGLQTEILYVRMGGKNEAISLENRFDYIQLPVLLKLIIIPGGPVRPVIYGGGYGAYLIKAKGLLGTEEADLTDGYERFDYGLVAGAGLEFKLAVVGLSVEARYNYGLSNVIKNPAAGESMKNRCLMVLFGISI